MSVAQKGGTADPPLRLSSSESLFAGAVAGFTARCLTAPLDLVKIRFQLDSPSSLVHHYGYSRGVFSTLLEVARKEGARALWKGNVPGLMMVVPFSATQFSVVNAVKPRLGRVLKTPYDSLVSGAVAGIAATLVTYPLDFLRTNFAASTLQKGKPSVPRLPSSFFRGLGPTALAIAPTTALSFAFFAIFSNMISEFLPDGAATGFSAGLAGGAAGTLSKLTLLPMDTIKKNMQVSPSAVSMSTVAVRLWTEGGVRGLWRGTAPSLLKAAPNSALHFGVFEATKEALLRRKRRTASGAI